MRRLSFMWIFLVAFWGGAQCAQTVAQIREDALFSEMLGEFLDADLKPDPMVITMPPPAPYPDEVSQAKTFDHPRVGAISKDEKRKKFPWTEAQMAQWEGVFSDATLSDAQRAQKIRSLGGPDDIFNAAAFWLLPRFGSSPEDPVRQWVEAQAVKEQPKAVLISAAIACFSPRFSGGDAGEKRRQYLRGRQQLLELAKQGNPDVLAFLGRQFFFSQNQEETYADQAEWLEKSANKGNAQSQYLWALYLIGKGTRSINYGVITTLDAVALQRSLERDIDRLDCLKPPSVRLMESCRDVYERNTMAVNWLCESAQKGYLPAQYFLGILAYNHVPESLLTLQKNDRRALAKAAAAGHFGASYEYALKCASGTEEGKGIVDAMKMHRSLIETLQRTPDDPWSRADADIPLVQNEVNVLEWLNKADYYGDPWAGMIAKAYLRQRDDESLTAARRYALAVQCGDDYELGMCNHLGVGVRKNEDNAARYFANAVEKNSDVRAQQMLDEYYPEVMGRFFDPASMGRLQARAQKGDVSAQVGLGLYYFNRGRHDFKPDDYEKAVDYLEQAAKNGSARAQYRLWKYFSGDSYRDFAKLEKAFGYLRQSAEGGYLPAQSDLGDAYYKGLFSVVSLPNQRSHTKFLVECGRVSEAAKWWESAAQQENLANMRKMIDCYASGAGVEKDPARAFAYAQAITRLYPDSSDGTYLLALCYLNGVGVPRDSQKAMKIVLDFIGKKQWPDPTLSYRMGLSYFAGKGVPKDRAKALACFESAAKQENGLSKANMDRLQRRSLGVPSVYPEAKLRRDTPWIGEREDPLGKNAGFREFIQNTRGTQENLWNELHGGRSPKPEWTPEHQKRAVEMLRAAVPVAYRVPFVRENYQRLADCPELVMQECLAWLRAAADAGDAEAQSFLGILYYAGFWVERDPKQAEIWLRKAVADGSKTARARLHYVVLDLGGSSAEKQAAFAYFSEVSPTGYSLPRDMDRTALCYERGVGVPIDPQKAFSIYWEYERWENVARCYFDGVGVEIDRPRALAYWRSNYSIEESERHYRQGVCLLNGIGCMVDEIRGASFLLFAAREGHKDAQYELGRCYEQGVGVPKDRVESYYLYAAAAKQGHAQAAEAMERVKDAL